MNQTIDSATHHFIFIPGYRGLHHRFSNHFFCLVPRLGDLSCPVGIWIQLPVPKANIIRVMGGNPGYAELGSHPCAPIRDRELKIGTKRLHADGHANVSDSLGWAQWRSTSPSGMSGYQCIASFDLSNCCYIFVPCAR